MENLLQITVKQYEEAREQLKRDSHHTSAINDFLDAVDTKSEFRLENLKLFAKPNFIAAMTILAYQQQCFYDNKK